MSLINDALKRAQKQRTGDSQPLSSLPSVGGQPAARIARRDKPVGFNSLIVRLALGAGGIVLVLAVGGYLILRAPRPPPAPPDLVTGAAPPPTAAAAAPLPAPSSSSAAIAFALPSAAPAKPAPVARETKPPAPIAPPTPPAKLDSKAISYIDSLRIAGIRASATDSKVLMNDHVYRVGDIVEHDLGLKLAGITADSLTFEDERGGRHTRNF